MKTTNVYRYFYSCLISLFLFPAVVAATAKSAIVKKLSLSEHELYLDAQMPVEKLVELHEAKISLEEYFGYPWLQLGITEPEWIRQRQAGIISNDRETTRSISKQEFAVVQNFFFPGLHQFRRRSFLKGFLMSGTAIASCTLYAMHSNPRENRQNGFDYPAYLLLLGADLLWSSIDIGIQVHKELNQSATRFSFKWGVANPLDVL